MDNRMGNFIKQHFKKAAGNSPSPPAIGHGQLSPVDKRLSQSPKQQLRQQKQEDLKKKHTDLKPEDAPNQIKLQFTSSNQDNI